ncbi:MAG: hypothetical protein JW953_01520 [Anaerolineae bacterium]|nr:hypothetical protein [Anaerolineae bacterium]
MSERSRIYNGRFLHNLDNWTASNASYSAGDGDDHYGVAVLETGGGYVEQDFVVTGYRTFTLHLSVKAVGSDLSGSQATATITDGDGNTVTAENLSGTADTWTENEISVGLAEGTTYTLTLTNASAAGDVKIDDVWLWFVPLTRAQIAAAVARKLGRVATDRSYSTTLSGTQTEGDYTDAVDDALRTMGAIDPKTGLTNVRWADSGMVKAIIDAALQAMLEKAQIDYAVEVDFSIGPHSEQLSQKRAALKDLTSAEGGAGNRQVVSRPLRHEREDYTW